MTIVSGHRKEDIGALTRGRGTTDERTEKAADDRGR